MNDFYKAIGTAVTTFANAITTAVGACETIAASVASWFEHLFGDAVPPDVSQQDSFGISFGAQHYGSNGIGTAIDSHFALNNH